MDLCVRGIQHDIYTVEHTMVFRVCCSSTDNVRADGTPR